MSVEYRLGGWHLRSRLVDRTSCQPANPVLELMIESARQEQKNPLPLQVGVRRLKSGFHHAGSQGGSSAAIVARTRDDVPTAPTVARYLARRISMYIVACIYTYAVFFMPTRTSPDRLE